VNLPRELKWTPPRYQDISGKSVKLLSSYDGGTLVRLIAGDLAGNEGPGMTWTPITYAHATISPGARLESPWRRDFNAMVYVLSGEGFAGPERRPIKEGQLAIFDNGDALMLEASNVQESRAPYLDVLVLGGKPIREPIVFHGPFVMNSRDEIYEAIRDYHAGKMGTIPATRIDFSQLHGDRGEVVSTGPGD
jgi:redox-sensitive bicupin YhaK (pirin superfamily)